MKQKDLLDSMISISFPNQTYVHTVNLFLKAFEDYKFGKTSLNEKSKNFNPFWNAMRAGFPYHTRLVDMIIKNENPENIKWKDDRIEINIKVSDLLKN